MFYLPKYLMNSFDISMSFGLAEYFKRSQRQQIFNFHFILLKEKGISFISVPNAFCFPYRIAHLFLKLFNKFPLLEIPFTHAELKKNAYLAGYKSCEIVSSCFINAFDEFLIKNTLYFFAKRLGMRNFLKKKRLRKEIPTILDDYLGYSLTLIGYK